MIKCEQIIFDHFNIIVNIFISALPKDAIVIKLYLHEQTLQIFGKQLSIRPTERTVKKFKTAHTFEL